MLLPLIQLLLVCCILLLGAMPVAFLGLLSSHLFHRRCGRGLLMTGCFTAGALVTGLSVWRLALSVWTLPFWTTLAASVNAEKYGHPLEHEAEQILTLLIFAAVLGGAATAGTAALGGRMSRRFAQASATGRRGA